jgi:hypothetical protein
MKFEIGTKITWKCAAGELTGTIKNIVLSPNAADQTIPWITVEDIVNIHTGKQHSNTQLCASHSGLLQLKITAVDEEFA